MAIKNDREYRNLGSLQVDESNEVVGYASTFDTYMLYEENGVKLYERIDQKAFDDADMSDVVFLRDHAGRVLARTKNGSVQLWTDEHGLASKTNLGLTGAAKEMLEDISVGNYTQMSFSSWSSVTTMTGSMTTSVSGSLTRSRNFTTSAQWPSRPIHIQRSGSMPATLSTE